MDYLDFYELRTVTEPEIKEAAEWWVKSDRINKKKSPNSKFAKDRFIRDASRWFEMFCCL